jgi:hypothetical protein
MQPYQKMHTVPTETLPWLLHPLARPRLMLSLRQCSTCILDRRNWEKNIKYQISNTGGNTATSCSEVYSKLHTCFVPRPTLADSRTESEAWNATPKRNPFLASSELGRGPGGPTQTEETMNASVTTRHAHVALRRRCVCLPTSALECSRHTLKLNAQMMSAGSVFSGASSSPPSLRPPSSCTTNPGSPVSRCFPLFPITRWRLEIAPWNGAHPTLIFNSLSESGTIDLGFPGCDLFQTSDVNRARLRTNTLQPFRGSQARFLVTQDSRGWGNPYPHWSCPRSGGHRSRQCPCVHRVVSQHSQSNLEFCQIWQNSIS